MASCTKLDDDEICADPDFRDNRVLPESLSAPSLRSRDQDTLFMSTSSHLRMHRSPVRPFFCCGSELSLVSLPDQQELRPITKPFSAQYSIGTISDESSGACAEVVLDNGRTCVYADGRVVRERPPRKKKIDGFQHKMSRKSWAVKLRGKLPRRLKPMDDHGNAMGSGVESSCTCTSYRQNEDNTSVYTSHSSYVTSSSENSAVGLISVPQEPETQSSVKGKGAKAKGRSLKAKSQIHQVEDLDKSHRAKKARQTVGGGDPAQRASWAGRESDKLLGVNGGIDLLCTSFQNQCALLNNSILPWSSSTSNARRTDPSTDSTEDECQYSDVSILGARAPYVSPAAHTQVDYVHCLVPDLSRIANCSFYWGVMDRYEAEKLLENKPEGTFLLRDSAQEEFLFSVSFRRYARSLHARVEQFQHKFSFDSHDPGVFATNTVCGLIEHYKDPSCCMFFEPMLTLPLNRSYPFSLQHLCRSTIASSTTYDGINQLPLPNALKGYLKYYHYKHKVRVRQLLA